MSTRDEALAALGSTDWSGSKVDTQPVDNELVGAKPVDAEPNAASIVFSVRLRGELADWVAAEADRRGVNPSAVIRDAVTAGRAAAVADEPITVTRSDLHRLIDRLPAA
jgi:hypothetical protein